MNSTHSLLDQLNRYATVRKKAYEFTGTLTEERKAAIQRLIYIIKQCQMMPLQEACREILANVKYIESILPSENSKQSYWRANIQKILTYCKLILKI